MEFSYGIIAAVGVLVAASLGLIAASPDEAPGIGVLDAPRMVSCTEEYTPVCGADGLTYSNMCKMNNAGVLLAHDGECGQMAVVAPMTFPVDIPAGTAVPGCEEDDACFVPSTVTVVAGDTVMWSNSDTAAHTVTAGTIAAQTGMFDSGLFLPGDTFEFTFDDPGEYDYVCIVHPWMEGTVVVQDAMAAMGMMDAMDSPEAMDAMDTMDGMDAMDGPDTMDAMDMMDAMEAEIKSDAMGEMGMMDAMDKPDAMPESVVDPEPEPELEPEPKPEPEPEPEPVPEPAPEPEPKPEPEPEPEPAPEPIPAPEPEAPTEMSGQATVSIPEGSGHYGCETTRSCFEPYEITVEAGSAVTWTNDDSEVHTVTSGQSPIPDKTFTSEYLFEGDSYQVEFDEPGTYHYFCVLHPWTTGVVTVE